MRNRIQTFALPSALITVLAMSGCGKDNAASSSTAVTSLSGGVTAMQKKVNKESPQITGSSLTGAFHFQKRPVSYADFRNWFLPNAFAGNVSLSLIWDPNNGSAPTGSQLAVNNLYNGGGATQSGNTCTINGVSYSV